MTLGYNNHHHHKGVVTRVVLLLLFLLACPSPSTVVVALTLLSDIATPALLLDVGFLCKRLKRRTIPSLQLDDDDNNKKNVILVPQPLLLDDDDEYWCPHAFDDDTTADHHQAAPPDVVQQLGVCYWHATVTRGRKEATATDDSDTTSFLAQLDVPSSSVVVNTKNHAAHLVLGLNNHHVISYYWARSAGNGACMEAPGIVVVPQQQQPDDGYACLAWQDADGPQACNSNDGKRSEWVNFLRPGDQVQLVPHDATRAILQATAAPQPKTKIYGVSSYQRPMGSEPAVVCEWIVQENGVTKQ